MSERIFLYLLRAVITSGAAAVIVMTARLFLKKAPRKWSYILWFAVFFRCLCPVSAEWRLSVFNLIEKPVSIAESTICENIDTASTPYDDAYIRENYEAYPEDIPENKKNDRDIYDIIIAVWLAGASVMFINGAVSYVKISGLMRTAVRVRENIYCSDRISTAFALGMIRPKIYIPLDTPEKERELIICHERQHIRRGDNIAKPAAYLALCLYWFDPVIWAAFMLMTKDMEMSCDEAVIKMLGEEKRTEYSEALLRVSLKKSGFTAAVAFGETGVKARLKNVLGYKKARPWVSAAAALLVLTACAAAGTDAVKKELYQKCEPLASDRYHDPDDPDKALPEDERPEFYINSKGQTYGHKLDESHMVEGPFPDVPDLVSALGRGGSFAYIRKEDFTDIDNARKNYEKVWEVTETGYGEYERLLRTNLPMYNCEGEQINDYFQVGGVKDYTYVHENKFKEAVLDEKSLNGYPSLAIPLSEPAEISKGYMPPKKEGGSFHGGIDFKVHEGTAVLAAAEGYIVQSGDYDNGYGNCVVIKHGSRGDRNMFTVYAHLSEVNMRNGKRVEAGDIIGYSGKEGFFGREALHFEVRFDGGFIDPEKLLDK